ncbi:MAG: TOBE domain-containing protein [Geodermatophilaceae bacterium]|nr:TOBE domain-containing protein [Geodermatophilaceae bacterium]
MLPGRIEAQGHPAEFYTAPPTLRAARFFGGTNEIRGAVVGQEFFCALGRLRVAPGGRPNSLTATVLDVRFHGTHHTVRLALPGAVTFTVAAPPTLALGPSEVMSVHLPPAACRVFPGEPESARAASPSDTSPQESFRA